MKKFPCFTIPIWLLWCIVILLSFGGYVIFFIQQNTITIAHLPLIITLAVLTGGWIYLSLRIFRFYIRLRYFLRRLLANDYSTGIRDISWLKDELTKMTELTNRAADQLRSYDELRAERTGLSFRAMDLLFRSSVQGIILADMGKKIFRFNPVAQEMYGVKQESYSFETIENHESNARFFRLFLIATLKDAITKKGSAVLQLPQRETAREISFVLEPLKDNTEKVRVAFIFITSVKEKITDQVETSLH